MFKFLIFAVLLFTPCALARPQARAPRLDGRIVGGTPADISEAPYQVALLLDWYEIGLFYQACGGSIISESVIVSAAHCPEDTTASQWQIRAGSTFSGSGGQVKDVSRTVMHPQYDEYELDYDISLFFLSSPLNIDGASTALIPLPTQGQNVVDGSSALVTGWGSTQEGGSTVSTLMQVTIPIVNQEICSEAYSNFGGITDRMICAGNLASGGQDACQGDSGGPLAVNGVLIGITSWGYGCARPGYPGVWTRVPYFRDWIENEIGSK